jgi:pyruvate carboxylase
LIITTVKLKGNNAVNDIDFVDQTMQDAQQSLWGFRMGADMILPIATVMDQVGYRVIAVVGGHGGVVASRYLHEDILERYQHLAEIINKTPLSSSFTTWSTFGFDIEPLAPIGLWIKQAVANGTRSFWVCDYQLQMDRLSYLVKVAKEEGAAVVCTALHMSRAEEICEMLNMYGHDTLPIQVDVSKYNQVRATFKQVADKFGRLDVFVNNADITTRSALIGETDVGE